VVAACAGRAGKSRTSSQTAARAILSWTRLRSDRCIKRSAAIGNSGRNASPRRPYYSHPVHAGQRPRVLSPRIAWWTGGPCSRHRIPPSRLLYASGSPRRKGAAHRPRTCRRLSARQPAHHRLSRLPCPRSVPASDEYRQRSSPQSLPLRSALADSGAQRQTLSCLLGHAQHLCAA